MKKTRIMVNPHGEAGRDCREVEKRRQDREGYWRDRASVDQPSGHGASQPEGGSTPGSCRAKQLTFRSSECYVRPMLNIEEERAEPLVSSASVDARTISHWSGKSREQAVQRMFTAIARWYDLNNTVLSFGLHHRWKRMTASFVPMIPGGHVIDIGAGTGDLALLLSGRVAPDGRVLALDLNEAMLREGLRKIHQRGLARHVTCYQGNGEWLAFRNESLDAATAGFCMRNVGNLMQALREVQRVLK